ncbi:MAG: hypothetical protein JWM53_158 [bacterium]|nr:hypothetical protein [bacterium]
MNTVYLSRQQMARLRRLAGERNCPQAAFIRAGVEAVLDEVEAMTEGVPLRVLQQLRVAKAPTKERTRAGRKVHPSE